MSRTVIIVGAGPGGLAAAIALASAGVRVQVFERASTVGGRTSAIEQEGFRFDVGPTFFLYPRVLDEIFQAAGTRLSQEVEMVRLDPQYRIQFENGARLDATPNVSAMEKQIAAISPADASGFAAFLKENRTKLQAMEPCLETPYLGWRDLLSTRLLKLLPLLRPHQSLDSYLKRFFKDPRVRLAFCFQSKYLGMSPYRCPSLFSILSFLEYEHGVFHPVGGCAEVTRAMARVARQCGAEIQLNAPVERVIIENGRAKGVVVAGERHEADAVVMNADFARAMERLVPDLHRRKWKDRALKRKKFSCSTFMLYLGVRGRYELPHHTIFIADEYDSNLKDIEQRHVLSPNPSFYVQNACVTDPRLAPAGYSTLYVLVPVTHQHSNVDWSRERSRFRELALNQIEKAGYKDVRSRICFERMITPADWDQGFDIYKGATFNLAHSLDQLLHLRPRNRFEDIPGMYLVGGGTHPGSGLPVIFEGARITSRLLLQDFGIAAPVTPDLLPVTAAATEVAELRNAS